MDSAHAKKQKRCARYCKELLRSRTEAELRFAKILRSMNIRYIEQKGFIAGRGFCIVDFYLPKPRKICIEIDGGYHKYKETRIKDKRKEAYLLSRGFRVCRFTNEEVLAQDITRITNVMSNTHNLSH